MRESIQGCVILFKWKHFWRIMEGEIMQLTKTITELMLPRTKWSESRARKLCFCCQYNWKSNLLKAVPSKFNFVHSNSPVETQVLSYHSYKKLSQPRPTRASHLRILGDSKFKNTGSLGITPTQELPPLYPRLLLTSAYSLTQEIRAFVFMRTGYCPWGSATNTINNIGAFVNPTGRSV